MDKRRTTLALEKACEAEVTAARKEAEAMEPCGRDRYSVSRMSMPSRLGICKRQMAEAFA